jgi:hypothetical protein
MSKIELCKAIQQNVSKLTESENLELFKIILDTKANYTKNNNGIFLNLNWIEEDLLVKINNYIIFCIKSQNEISKYELMKTMLNDSINTRDTTLDEADSITALSSSATATSGTMDVSTYVSSATYASSATDANNQANTGDAAIPVSIAPKQKFSSSMKFYLLKKKFMKQNTSYATSCQDNDLTYEDYLIT